MERGLSQRQASEAIGLTRNAFGNYEAEIREPSLSVLKSICDFFDVSADYLIGRSENFR